MGLSFGSQHKGQLGGWFFHEFSFQLSATDTPHVGVPAATVLYWCIWVGTRINRALLYPGHMGMGQNYTTRGFQVLVLVSFSRVLFWVPIFDSHPPANFERCSSCQHGSPGLLWGGIPGPKFACARSLRPRRLWMTCWSCGNAQIRRVSPAARCAADRASEELSGFAFLIWECRGFLPPAQKWGCGTIGDSEWGFRFGFPLSL